MSLKFYLSLLIVGFFSLGAYSQYCTPTYTNACTSGDYIDDFVFSTISNLATGCTGAATSNYTDYSGTISTTVTQGGTYAVTCAPGPTWGQFFGVWIDFNNDTDFVDVGEYFPIGYAAGGASVTTNITIPAGAPIGSCRMRVLCQFGTGPLVQADVCSAVLAYGEVEDYGINIIAQPAKDAGLTAIVSPLSGCGLSSAEVVMVGVGNTGADTIFSTQVCYRLNGGSPVCETMNDTILPNDTVFYSFTNTANVGTPGAYVLDAWTNLTGDSVAFNDSLFGYNFDHIPQVSSLPYTEGFESGNGGWVSSGASNSWALGAPVNTFIPAAANGANAWVTNLSGDYNNSELSYLTSPCFDFSGLANDPKLRFSHIFDSETNFDDSWVEVTTNGGTNWSKLYVPGQGTNWYNDTTDKVWEGSSGAAGVWRIAEHTMTGTAGSGDVRIRFAFESDGSVSMEGFGVDNIAIFDTLIDVSVSSLLRPTSACGLSATDTIEIEVKNLGTISVNNIPVCYIINGGSPVCEVLAGPLAPGATVNYVFTATANLAATGLYTFDTYTSLAADSSKDNDTLTTLVDNIPVVNTFPYTEGFENGNAGWTSEGTNNSWALGTPIATYVNAAAAGQNAWVTNLSADYANSELSYLISPCFDFSGLAIDPKLRFSHIFITESCCDEGWVDVSTDGGQTWNLLPGSALALNWYNDTTNNWWDGNSGTPGVWRVAEVPLTGLAGQGDVKFRWAFASDGSVTEEGFGVDNVSIFDTLIDVSVVSINGPASSCGMGTDTIDISFTNYSTLALSAIPVCYAVNGGTPVCETIAGPIPAGSSVQFSFSTLYNFSTPGQYNIVSYTTLAADSAKDNDTAIGTVINVNTISTFPYVEDFESGQGDWVSGGTGSSWAFGTPAKTTINSAASGMNAWVNGGLSGSYNNNEASFVIGPCMNFSSMANPWVKLDVWWESEFSWDGAALQASTDDGMTWANVGQAFDPYNWYNDSTVTGLNNYTGSGMGWTGTGAFGSSGWVVAKHDLGLYAGMSSVRLRITFGSDGVVTDEGFAFDNFVISEGPALDFGADSTICDSTYVLDPGFSTGDFAWSTGDSTSTLTVDSTGMYGLIYTDTNGICAEDSIMLGISLSAPSVEIGNDTTICIGAQLCLDAGSGPGWVYSWSNGNTNQNTCFSGSSTIAIVVADSVGCTASDSLDLTSIAPPIIGFTADTSLCPLVSFSSNNTGGAVDTWNWSFGDGNGSSASNPVNTYAMDSSYNVVLIATNGCSSDTSSLSVVVNCLIQGISGAFNAQFEVYPNPASSEFFLRFGSDIQGKVEVQLSDLSGKLISNWEIANVVAGEAQRLDLDEVSRGVYLLQVKSGTQTMISKLVIE